MRGAAPTSTLLPRICHEKTAIQRQIEATDGQIDRLVYELYGLKKEMIGIVKCATILLYTAGKERNDGMVSESQYY